MQTTDTQDLIDTAVANGSFTTLAAALEAAGLVEALRAAGPFTVFAPTDAAFAALPAGTIDDLLQPQNRDVLRRVLTYHVVAGRVRAADAARLTSAEALSGDAIAIRAGHGTVKVNQATVVTADIEASNGVIHVIDSVILPPGL